MTICTRCVMDDSSDATIRFDELGHCSYCSEALARLKSEYHPDNGWELLEGIANDIKEQCSSEPYDCIVGVSGGIDSSYIIYLGYKLGLRMLAVHVDDGLDNPIATSNIDCLCKRTNTRLEVVSPDLDEYKDVLLSLLKASVPNLAILQDNLIMGALQTFGEESHARYILDGSNFAHESILQRGSSVNSSDAKYISSIQKRFGSHPIHNLRLTTLSDRYIRRNYLSRLKHVRPLNYINYNLEICLRELEDFCGFKYYGGKHYESILTRFMQCYYLPVKFGIDKRKSHYSSLIISGQMSREEALQRLKEPLYASPQMLADDKETLSTYLGISIDRFDELVSLPPKSEYDYPHSLLNEAAPIARRFRRFLD